MVDSRVVAGNCSSLLDLALIGSSLLCQGCRSPCRKTLRPSSQRLASWLGKTNLSTRPRKCAASFLLLPSQSSRTSKRSRWAKSAHDTSPQRQIECLYQSFIHLCQKSLSIDSLFGSRFGAGPGRAWSSAIVWVRCYKHCRRSRALRSACRLHLPRHRSQGPSSKTRRRGR